MKRAIVVLSCLMFSVALAMGNTNTLTRVLYIQPINCIQAEFDAKMIRLNAERARLELDNQNRRLKKLQLQNEYRRLGINVEVY
jgi:hypothetical protein